MNQRPRRKLRAWVFLGSDPEGQRSRYVGTIVQWIRVPEADRRSERISHHV